MRYSDSKERNAQTAPAKATTKSGFEPRFASEGHVTPYNHCTGQEANGEAVSGKPHGRQ